MTERERFEAWFNGRSPHSKMEILKSEQWAAWQAARRWIPVTEKLPEEGKLVLYYFEQVGIHSGCYTRRENMNCFYGAGGWLCDDVTHWQPLPELPEEEK